jgi:hypothetical protein
MNVGIEQNRGWLEPICEADCRIRLRSIGAPFYVYVLHKPDGTPFYVGKGVGLRVLHHVREARNRTTRLTHKLNTIRAIERRGGIISYSVSGVFDDEAEAHRREMMLIGQIGRYDLGLGPLTNQTDGGEGGSNPSQESRSRRASTLAGDDAASEERRAANRFFKELLDVGSVPIKQLGSLTFEPLTAHPSARKPTARQAAALAASALTNRVLIEVDARLPRRITFEGFDGLIENGVGRDILKSGLAELAEVTVPEDEVFVLTTSGVAAIRAFIPADILISGGVLLPPSGAST